MACRHAKRSRTLGSGFVVSATAAVKVRLHQRRFRELVLPAWQVRCAVRRLKRDELLDAAHILPDRDERCRHEAARGLAGYDANILGVAPDYVAWRQTARRWSGSRRFAYALRPSVD